LPKSPQLPKIQIEKLSTLIHRWFTRSLSAMFGNFGISGNFLIRGEVFGFCKATFDAALLLSIEFWPHYWRYG
jgi:hypothetical protein